MTVTRLVRALRLVIVFLVGWNLASIFQIIVVQDRPVADTVGYTIATVCAVAAIAVNLYADRL